MIHRRSAIKFLLMSSAGLVLANACRHRSKALIVLQNFNLDLDEENLIAQISETIIPDDLTPGAKSIGAHLFALKMLDDCYTQEEREHFFDGLSHFNKASHEFTGKDFIHASPSQREALLEEIESGSIRYPYIGYCYGEIKNLTMRAYTTSQYYLTKVNIYEMVPGRWHGCAPVKA